MWRYSMLEVVALLDNALLGCEIVAFLDECRKPRRARKRAVAS